MAESNRNPIAGQLLPPKERAMLLAVARDALERAGRGRPPIEPDLDSYPEPLRAIRACFVTLETGGALRGCIGTLQGRRPLVIEVAHMARAAAMDDPRFPEVTSTEVDQIDISISVLSPSTPLEFSSEDDLLAKLRPGVDGLILRDGYHTGTFLPSVWDKLPSPRDFLRQLKRKAGLPPDHWSDRLTVERYTTESFAEGD